MIKQHPKIYENVFSYDSPRSSAKLKIEKVVIDGMELGEYQILFKDFLKGFYSDLFFQCVCLSWLRKKFTYYGFRFKTPTYSSIRFIQGSFTKFLRRFVGDDIQIITKSFFFPKLEENYFNIFFPDMADHNPFKEPEYFKFPFQNISLEYLLLVYQLDDRIGLLEEADKQKMTYAVFLDYVINYVYTENEILNKNRYLLFSGADRQFPLFFKDTEKHFRSLKGEKRI